MPIKRIYPDMSMQSTSTTVSASSASASSASTPVFLRRCPWDAGQEQILITEVRSPDRCMDITEPKYTLIGTYWQEVASAAQVHREFHNIQISSKSVKDHFNIMIANQRALMKAPQYRSGSTEKYGEVTRDIEEIIEGLDEHEEFQQNKASRTAAGYQEDEKKATFIDLACESGRQHVEIGEEPKIKRLKVEENVRVLPIKDVEDVDSLLSTYLNSGQRSRPLFNGVLKSRLVNIVRQLNEKIFHHSSSDCNVRVSRES